MTDVEFNKALKYANNWRRKKKLIATTPETIEHTLDLLTDAIFRINSKIEGIKRLQSELAALKERYRWRKQSEEPAPEGEIIGIIRLSGENVALHHTVVVSGDFIVEKRTGRKIHLDYWRPLDLPEEEKAE